MVSNFEYFRTPSGMLKCCSIVAIAITLALSVPGTLDSEYLKNRENVRPNFPKGVDEVSLWREFYLIASSGVCLIISIINLIAHALSRNFYWERKTAIYDFLYQSLSFGLLSTSSMLNIISAVKLFEINCSTQNECQHFELKFAAGGVGLVAALFCGIVAVVVLTNRKEVERDGMLADEK